MNVLETLRNSLASVMHDILVLQNAGADVPADLWDEVDKLNEAISDASGGES